MHETSHLPTFNTIVIASLDPHQAILKKTLGTYQTELTQRLANFARSGNGDLDVDSDDETGDQGDVLSNFERAQRTTGAEF